MININDYTYHLPEHRIAKFPIPIRDQSRLLVYKDSTLAHHSFKDITSLLPSGALVVFNNTKVIPARLHFFKKTGAEIEIFLLTPESPSTLLIQAMQSQKSCAWLCTIGNLKRWTEGAILEMNMGETVLLAKLIDRSRQLVEFFWNTETSFAEIIHLSGKTPLPPYLKREPVESDKERYQTIYSQYDGAVAAPTAGLHFTPSILEQLRSKGVKSEYVTLHVSAGTFQPVKVQDALTHEMHAEQIVVSRTTIESLLNHGSVVIPVGTTSMRTLESLYWMGKNVLDRKPDPFHISQHDPYGAKSNLPDAKQAFAALLVHLDIHQQKQVIGHTSIFIHPGYDFKVCDALITNFHQPGSTLILLVASFVGPDWKKIYASALENDYRFLSYGDSSLLWKNNL